MTLTEPSVLIEYGKTLAEERFAAADGTPLHRWSCVPKGDVCARVALLPGYGDHGYRYRHFLTQMAQWGMASHALDFRGQGKSGGRRGYAERWDDYLTDVTEFLAQDALQYPQGTPLFLLGQSHGALVAAVALIRRMLPEVAGCILTAPYFRNKAPVPAGKFLLAHVANRFCPHMTVPTDVGNDCMTSDPEMQTEDRNDPLALGIATPRWFLSMQQAQKEALKSANCFATPLLILAGKADSVSDNAATREFFQRVDTPDKTLEILSGCRHEPLREKDRAATYERIHDWLCERIP